MTQLVFETKAYKDSLMENKLLHSLLYGLSKTLEEEISAGMGYPALSRVGSHMIQYLKKYGFKPTESRDPYERIAHLCKFYVDEGMVKKICLKRVGGKVELKAYQLFGSPVFCDLHLEKGLKHIRPCPLFAMILAQLSEINYVSELKKLDYDKNECVWRIRLEILEMA